MAPEDKNTAPNTPESSTRRQPWSAPSLTVVRIADATRNGGSSGTDGKGGSETGITAS